MSGIRRDRWLVAGGWGLPDHPPSGIGDGSWEARQDCRTQAPTTSHQPLTTTDKKNIKLEGCLSIPHIWGPVTRNTKILLEYQDLTGEKHSEWFSGFTSVIIQHEMDHLQGVLFTQRVLEQKGRLYQEKDGKLEKIEG